MTTAGATRGGGGAPRPAARAPWLLVALAACAGGSARAAGCPSGGGEPVSVAAVEARGELRLADGRLIRLVGLDPAEGTPEAPDRADAARAALAGMLAARPVTLLPLAGARDRWGRVPAFVFAGEGAGAAEGGLAAAAVAAGLGRVLPEAAAHACRDALLRAEGAARAAKLGLWADPYYAVLDVDDERAFAERSGTRVVAGGTVVAVEPGPFRTVLRLAPYRGTVGPEHVEPGDVELGDVEPGNRPRGMRRMLTATVPARARKAFEARHVDVGAYLGRTLRVRGLLDLRFGPRVELAGPDDVEVVSDAVSGVVPDAVAAPPAVPSP